MTSWHDSDNFDLLYMINKNYSLTLKTLLYLFTWDPYEMFHRSLTNVWDKNCKIWPTRVIANTGIILLTLSTATGALLKSDLDN